MVSISAMYFPNETIWADDVFLGKVGLNGEQLQLLR